MVTASLVLGQLQKMTEGLQSGDDTPLKNVWDEICVQVQGEESIMWDAYLEVIRSLIQNEVDNTDIPTKEIIWLQTEGYIDWEKENENPSELVFNDEDILDYILHSFVLPVAGGWTNKRIEKYRWGEFD